MDQNTQTPAEPMPNAPQTDPLPTRGGCWVRQPDGSLAPEPATEPPAAEQKE